MWKNIVFFLVFLLSPISCWHVTHLSRTSAGLMNERWSLHHSQSKVVLSVKGYFVCLIKKKIIITINGCLQIWNFSSRVQLHIFLVRCTHSWAVECNSTSTRAHVLFAMWFLTNFFHCRSYAANFWFYFFLFLFLSCWISSANNLIWMFVTFVISIELVSFWFGLFISVILI